MEYFFSIFIYSFLFLARKPKNKNLSVLDPDMIKTSSNSSRPGIGIIFILFFNASCTNLYPGSESKGVPASETKDTILFLFISLIIVLIFVDAL